jgi:hypothetical protein
MTSDKNTKDRYKELIYKLIFPYYKNNISLCLSETIRENIQIFNIDLLCQILKVTTFYEFFDLNIHDLIQYKFIAFVIENIPSLNLLETLTQHLFDYNKKDNPNKEEYIRYFNDCLKGLLLIYKDESKSPRHAIAACKILICLCSADSSGEAITSIVNLDAITIIAKRINVPDYRLFLITIFLLFVISEKIRKVNLTETVSNSELLLGEINKALEESVYRDEAVNILDSLAKVLYNFIASDSKKGLLRNNIILQVRESIGVTFSTQTLNDYPEEGFRDRNIICHLLNYYKKPYFIEQLKSESSYDFAKYLKDIKHDNIRTCERFTHKRFDFKSFNKQCRIDDRIVKFFELLLVGNNNTEIINLFIFRYNIFKLIFDYKKMATMKYIFINYINIMEKNDDKNDMNEFVLNFPAFLICLCRLFAFTFYLLNENLNALTELNKKEFFKEHFYNLFDTVNKETENLVIKNLINDNKYAKDLSLYLSTMHSLKTILYPPEKDEEIDVIINNRK